MRHRPQARCSIAVLLLLLTVPTPASQQDEEDEAPELTEAELFFELNDTDGDLGIHASIDGDPWKDLRIEAPNDAELLRVTGRNVLRAHGLTQLSFESAEPTFDELDPRDFFRRFPEGQYEIWARSVEAGTMASRAMLSHVMPAPPANVQVNRVPAARSCDDPPPTVIAPVLIDWDPVTGSHPRIGRSGPVQIVRYEFFVEREGVKLGVDLPPAVTQFEIPRAITDLGKDFKFEIIARSASGNNTAVESCFRLP
jgi:hypothetical protein